MRCKISQTISISRVFKKCSLVFTSIAFDRITASSAIGIGPLPVIWESCQVVLSSRCSYTAPATFHKNIGDQSYPGALPKSKLTERKIPPSQSQQVTVTVPPNTISSTIVEANGDLKQMANPPIGRSVIRANAKISSIGPPVTKGNGAHGRVIAYCQHVYK